MPGGAMSRGYTTRVRHGRGSGASIYHLIHHFRSLMDPTNNSSTTVGGTNIKTTMGCYRHPGRVDNYGCPVVVLETVGAGETGTGEVAEPTMLTTTVQTRRRNADTTAECL